MGFLANADLSINRIEQARLASAGYIDLTSSNPTQQGLLFPPDVLREAAMGYWHTRRYAPDPRGDAHARAAIAAFYEKRWQVDQVSRFNSSNLATFHPHPPANLFITASTSEAYSLLFALLTEPGDNVLAPDVGYPLFDFLAAVHHIELRPYKLDAQRGWKIDEQSLLHAADAHTRAVLIVSPHNPTGAIVQAPIPNLQSLNLPVICDEVFAEFTLAAPATPLFSALHPQLPVFVLNGISKMFALPDLKLGWIALNDLAAQHYAARLEMLNDTFLSANYLTQHMLPTLFERGWPFVQDMVAQVRSNVDLALDILARNSRIKTHKPDGGYNLLCAVRGWPDEEALVLHLLAHGVLVQPGFYFNGAADEHGTHINISGLTAAVQLEAGLTKLIEII